MAAVAGQRFTFDPEDRVLVVAVVGSLLLHAALLIWLPMLREARQQREAREPIVARLVEPAPKPAPQVPAPSAIAAEPKKPVATPAARPAPEAKNRAAARATESARPPSNAAPRLAEAAPPTAQPAVPKTETAAAAQTTPVSEAPASVSTPSQNVEAAPALASRSSTFQAQPAPAGSDAADAGTLAQYRLSVISAARRYKRYPRLALENNWQGKVEIRMAISADGSISSLIVRSSTGHALLDQQALDMIERAKNLAQIPPALKGKQFVVDIPVEFLLRDAGA